MIGIDDVVLSEMVLHRVGAGENSSIISDQTTASSDPEEDAVFKRIFLKPFVSHVSTFEFSHSVDINYNVLFKLSKAIYDEEDFIENSKHIAQHLDSVSKHPNIKDGDVFIVKFEDVQLSNKHYRALGIFKYEDKESYIETSAVNKDMSLEFRKGIGTKKPDKGCLVIFSDEPYTILIIDSNSNETDYWQNAFIGHKPKNDAINNTNDFLSLAKNFITEQIPQDFNVSKTDQIDYLNRSVEYFKNHEKFDKGEFETEVFHHAEVIDSFNNYNNAFRANNDLELNDQFEISQHAVKKQARAFKSILKLDKNFHIYIHGNKDLIEQGVEQDGRKYYKIYYNQES
jgi:hypothetical protein